MILHSQERIQEYTKNGWWGTDTLDDLFRRNVTAEPDAPALADPLNRADLTDGAAQKFTYQQLDEMVDRLATILIEQGINKDNIIAVQLPNIAELVIVYLAAARIGAVVCPFPTQYREYELEQLVNFVEAKTFLTVGRMGSHQNAEMITALRPKLPTLQTIMAWGVNLPDTVLSLDNFMAVPHSQSRLTSYLAKTKIDANEVFTICWTSGTESMPKGVPRTHNDWIAIAYATVDGAELHGDDNLLNPFPLVNMAGIGGMLVPWLLTGSHLVMHQPFDLPTFLKQVAIEKINYTVAPPPLLNMLLMREEILAKTNISSLRTIGSGSAPLSPWMVKTWHEKYGIHVTNFFGSNEGTALISGPKDIPDPEKRARYFPRFGAAGYKWSGRVPQGIQTKLADVNTGGSISEPGKPGELRIKGPTVFADYWKGAERGLHPFDEDGYFCTGDVFEIAGEGEESRYYRYVDRAKDLIIRGGMNIAPAEVEMLLAGHPKLADVAVVGYPDPMMGEKACAVVVSREGQEITLEELVTFLQEKKIASYKLPERLIVVPALPRNPVGKVLKRDLREKLKVQ